ncbi:MAG TPA: MBL fold metallo-hydrolase [Bacillota bacterium]|nr:MBL fold metallo-hydrolase [Bacillota bacterium]
MELIPIKDHIYYFKAAVNIGVLKGEKGVIVIDTGLDKAAGSKIDKLIQSWNSTLLHIINTHSHADHFGGNHLLLKRYPDAQVWAPTMEEAFIQNPELEGICLFSGANPPKELQGKFLKAERSKIDHIINGDFSIDEWPFNISFVPGHAHQQISIHVNGVCFAGDCYFGREIVKKHKIPFLVDADLTLESLDRLLNSDSEFYVPGHGEMESREKVQETLRFNKEWHLDNLKRVQHLIEWEDNGLTTDQVVAGLAELHGIVIDNMTSYVLYQTAVLGYLRSLHAREIVEVSFYKNSWRWRKGH